MHRARKPAQGWKEAGMFWWKPGCLFLPVCGSVKASFSRGGEEGRPLAHRSQWTKSPLNRLIWFACRAAACPLSSNTASWPRAQSAPGFDPQHSLRLASLYTRLYFLFLFLAFLSLFLLVYPSLLSCFEMCSQSWSFYQGGTASLFSSLSPLSV